MLIEIVNGFLIIIIDGFEEVFYGICWICKQICSLIKRKYLDVNDQVICILIGGFFFLCFINFVIVMFKLYMLIDGILVDCFRRMFIYIVKML